MQHTPPVLGMAVRKDPASERSPLRAQRSELLPTAAYVVACADTVLTGCRALMRAGFRYPSRKPKLSLLIGVIAGRFAPNARSATSALRWALWAPLLICARTVWAFWLCCATSSL